MTDRHDGAYGPRPHPPAPQSGWTPAQPSDPSTPGYYGAAPVLPPPVKRRVPWLLVAAGSVVALAAAVLIVVATKDGRTPVADPSGSPTASTASSAAGSSSTDVEPPQPSDPTASGSSAATQAELESETAVMLKKFAAQDHDELVKWVCKKDADSFESSWQKGTFSALKDATFTITSSTLDTAAKNDSGAAAMGVVKATMAPAGGGSSTTTWPMSWRQSTANTYEWYVCPSDQPGVIDT